MCPLSCPYRKSVFKCDLLKQRSVLPLIEKHLFRQNNVATNPPPQSVLQQALPMPSHGYNIGKWKGGGNIRIVNSYPPPNSVTTGFVNAITWVQHWKEERGGGGKI